MSSISFLVSSSIPLSNSSKNAVLLNPTPCCKMKNETASPPQRV